MKSEENLQGIITDLNKQIMQKNKVIEKLKKNVTWYEKNTGVEIENEYDDETDNCKSNEIELKKTIRELIQKVNFLSEKKNYYKAKVIIKFYWI